MQKQHRLWPIAFLGVGIGLFAVVGGHLAGGEMGALLRGYGLLELMAAGYLAAGLAIRARLAVRRVPERPVGREQLTAPRAS